MRRCYARVEHKLVVGIDVQIAYLLCYFWIWWYCGMKQPGPNLLVLAQETGSTTDMQLVLHKVVGGLKEQVYSVNGRFLEIRQTDEFDKDQNEEIEQG